jgi:hypothetical protein
MKNLTLLNFIKTGQKPAIAIVACFADSHLLHFGHSKRFGQLGEILKGYW